MLIYGVMAMKENLSLQRNGTAVFQRVYDMLFHKP